MSQYIIQRLDSFGGVDQAEWDSVLAKASTQTIFQSYDWNRLVWEEHNADTLLLLAIYQQKTRKLVGFAPLFLSVREGLHQIHLIGGLRGDYADLILDQQYAKEVLALIIDYLYSQLPDVSTIHLEKVPSCSDVLAHVQAVYARTVVSEAAVCPTWIFAEDTQEQINKKLNNKKMRYYQRRLSKQGDYQVQHLRRADEIFPYLDAFYDQHIERWLLTPWPSRFLKQSERDFYYAQVQIFATKGEMLFSLISLDKTPVGFHLGFCSSERFIWYKPTYNVNYKKYSPGLVLMKECIQYAINTGCEEFDFAAGNEPYKGRFANHIRQNYNVVLYANVWCYLKKRTKDFLTLIKQSIKKRLRND